MSLLVDEQIVGLEIAVDDAAAVEMLNTQDDLSEVFLNPVLWETAKDFDQGRAVTTIEIFHHEVEVVLAGKGPVELGNEIALALPHHDGSLSFDVADLVLRHHVRLLQDFDGEVLASRFLLGQVDAAKSTFADGLDNLKVFDGGLRGSCLW